VLATILASLPYFVAGFADQPAASGTFDYEGPSELWNIAVLVGHALMVVVALAFVGLILRPARGAAATQSVGDDPWGGQTLEWLTTSPAPSFNFNEVPTVMSPEPVLDLRGPEEADR
jgi:heme/copper-type cytochrome/quinol oxidase subunit 1